MTEFKSSVADVEKFESGPIWEDMHNLISGQCAAQMSILMDPRSTETEIRVAQGAVAVIQGMLVLPAQLREYLAETKEHVNGSGT